MEWVGPEDSEEPASVVRVVEGSPTDSATQETEAPSGTGVSTSLAAYGGLGLGVLALIVALVALLRGNKT